MKHQIIALLMAGTMMSGAAMAESNHDQGRNQIEVGAGKKFKSIQAAVNSAKSGDTVVVSPGVYASFQPRAGVKVEPQTEGTVKILPKGYSSPWAGSGGSSQSAFGKSVGGVGANIGDTDEQIVNEILHGEAGAWQKLNGILSGDGVTGKVNGVVDKATGVVTGAIDDTIDGATDAVMNPIEDTVDSYADAAVKAVECQIGGSAAAMAGGAVSSIWGGGDATYGAQLAQWLSQTAGNLCMSKGVAVQNKILEYERRNNAHGQANNTAGINGMINRTMPGLGQGGFLSDEQAIQGAYEETYPDMFPPMSGKELAKTDSAMRQRERTAHMGSFGIQNRAIQEQAGSLSRARDYAAAGRAGEGVRAELQAMNAIGGEQIAAINSLTAATVGSSRAAAEVQLRKEARTAAANAAADDFMSTMTRCDNCQMSKPLIGN